MPSPMPQPRSDIHRPVRATRAHACSPDAAFTLVEVLIAMVIMAILFSAALAMNKSTKTATEGQRGVSVARAYGDAIDAFARDHGNRAPIPGTSDWPASNPPTGQTVDTQPPLARGPVDVGEASRPYLDQVPDPVASGLVIVASPQVSGSAETGHDAKVSPSSRVLYTTTDASTWRIAVQELVHSTDPGGATSWNTRCTVGHDLPKGVRSC
jgi:prepilin-type N-terminal cleavage/methylation domain-containing protein